MAPNRRRCTRAAIAISGLALFMLVPAGDCAQIVIGRAERDLDIVESGKKTVPGKGATAKQTTVSLIQVIPRQGNNPMNPIDPINNRDGRIVKEPSKGSPAPVMSTAPYKIDVQPWGREGWTMVTVDAARESYRLRSGSAASRDAVGIALYEWSNKVSVEPLAGNSNLQLVGGTPRLTFPNDGQQHAFDVRHVPTGKVFRFTFRADKTLPGNVTVLSMRRIL